jgi:KAP family P-loop domain
LAKKILLMKTDSISKEDLLGRDEFANDIATGIVKTTVTETNGFVIGLTGKWGSGKSTLLNFVKKHLQICCEKEKLDYTIIEFNPWQFTDEENIKKAFLKNFQKQLGYKKKSIRNTLKKWSWALRFSKMAGNVGEEIGGLIKDYLDNDTSFDLKKMIDDALVKSKKKVFVFIDDIDRLYPKQVFEILQVLKLTGGFLNTYYIISFDREAVEISIESQFKDYGKKYLDKIIQADFLIPEIPSEKIEEIFFASLKNLCQSHQITYNSSEFSSVWLHQGLRYYFKTLRDVYRYFNSIQFRLVPIHDEINITDFLILEAMRLYDFESYEFIYREYSPQVTELTITTNMTSNKELVNVELNNSKKLINYLFPDKVELSQTGINIKRLCNPKYFDRFFTLKINDSDIAEKDLKLIIESSENRQVKFQNIQKFGRLKSLILRLNDKNLNDYYKNWDYSLVNDLFVFFDDNALSLEKENINLTDAIVNLLTLKNKEDLLTFKKFMNLLMSHTSRVSLAKIYFLHFMILDKEKNTGFSDNSPAFKQYYLSQNEQLKSFYFKYLSDWQNSFLYSLSTDQFNYVTKLFVYDYAKYLHLEYREVLPKLLSNENNLIFFLNSILSINALDNNAFAIEVERLSHFIPSNLLNGFYEKVARMSTLNLSETEQQWRKFFLDETKKGLSNLIIPKNIQFTFKSQPLLSEDPNNNDHIFEKVFELTNNPFEIVLTPINSPFWRFGFKFSQQANLPRRQIGRHDDKTYLDVVICVGQPNDINGQYNWKRSNRIELSEHNIKPISDSFSVYNSYNGETLKITLSPLNKSLSQYSLELFINEKSIGSRNYHLEGIKYLTLAAWCDQHDFRIDANINYKEIITFSPS